MYMYFLDKHPRGGYNYTVIYIIIQYSFYGRLKN